MATPYVKQTWIDGDTTKPTSAARLGVMENGIFDAHYKPCVSVFQGSQSIATGSAITLLYPTESYDTDGEHSTVSNTGRLTAAVTGKRHIVGYCSFSASNVGARALTLNLNGVAQVSDTESFPGSGQACVLAISWHLLMTAGQFVELQATQTTAGALSVSSGFAMSVFAY